MEGVLAIIMVFGIPLAVILTSHHRKVLEMKLRLKADNQGRQSGDLAALQQQLNELRDTATRYDISFDKALQRIESRVAALEANVNGKSAASNTGSVEQPIQTR